MHPPHPPTKASGTSNLWKPETMSSVSETKAHMSDFRKARERAELYNLITWMSMGAVLGIIFHRLVGDNAWTSLVVVSLCCVYLFLGSRARTWRDREIDSLTRAVDSIYPRPMTIDGLLAGNFSPDAAAAKKARESGV